MKRPDPPSDRDIQEAFLALDGTVPDGHLDDFSSRVLARLDEPEVSGMDSRELARGSGLNRPDEAALGAVATPTEANVTPVREENSGLHEIKALASTTKRRISAKITSETEAEESLLVGASSGSFRAAALPNPAHATAASEPVSDRAVSRARDRLSEARPVARPASEVDHRRSLPSRGSSAPFWLLGGVATAAAAAAVAVFVFGVGREKKDGAESSASEVVAQATGSPAASGEAATGTVAPDGVRFAEPPPDQAAPGAAPAAASAPATIAANDPEAKAVDQQPADDGKAAEGGLKGRAGAGGDSKSTEHAADKSEPAKAKKDEKKDANEPKKSSAPTRQSGGKDLNDVLDQVTGGVQAPAPAEQEAPKKPTKKALDRRDVSKAMSAVRVQVMRCRDKEQYEGTVTVKFHVAPSGEVTSAEATGGKAGSPTGACVAAAVKKARFPAFDGAPTSFTYPFLLAE